MDLGQRDGELAVDERSLCGDQLGQEDVLEDSAAEVRHHIEGCADHLWVLAQAQLINATYESLFYQTVHVANRL